MFAELKRICVPLLAAAQLSSPNTSKVSGLLRELLLLLRNNKANSHFLPPHLCAYVFFPISTIFERNPAPNIPDYILEPVLSILDILIDSWWWDCQSEIWDQLFMLSVGLLSSMQQDSKSKDRDDETKLAVVQCLLQLLTPDRQRGGFNSSERTRELSTNAQRRVFLPVLGKAVDSLLSVVDSPTFSLQCTTLHVLRCLFSLYLPRHFIPTLLPGVVSKMCRIALGTSSKKGWANGDIVSGALSVMEVAIVGALADEVCIAEGALRSVQTLDDLISPLTSTSSTDDTELPTYIVRRTASWLQGTTSQVHIALNSLTPLMSHPTPSALLALVHLSDALQKATPSTLPQSQTLLLIWILTLYRSDYESVHVRAKDAIFSIVSSNALQEPTIVALKTIMRDSLAILPHLLRSGSEAQLESIAQRVEAICAIALSDDRTFQSLTAEIGNLLGPSGAVEKWGWSLISVVRIESPSILPNAPSYGQLLLEDESSASWAPFPSLSLKNVSQGSTYRALSRTLRCLGEVGSDKSLYSIEWFFRLGLKSASPESIAALWISVLFLQGSSKVLLEQPYEGASPSSKPSRSLRKLVQGICSEISEFWDISDIPDVLPPDSNRGEGEETESSIEIDQQKGLVQLHDSLKIMRNLPTRPQDSATSPDATRDLHRSLLLQLLSLASGVFQAKFPTTFIHTLYPILHSLVSPSHTLSSTALASLHFVTVQTSYASPANLLLSNFDYALDAVSRRLTRRWLDVDAAKVMALLVRIVGADIANRASDVVEECFDRLDDYHGYFVLVDGLTEVLHEVVKAISSTSDPINLTRSAASQSQKSQEAEMIPKLIQWLAARHQPQAPEHEEENYGPAPQRPWGRTSSQAEESQEPETGESPEEGKEAPLTPAQSITQQIILRAAHFLSHGSPTIRARILNLLASSVPLLDASHLMSHIHTTWPIIVNRLGDNETFVVSAAATLVEALALHVGDLMFFKVWDDVWPRFQTLLKKLAVADSQSALVRRHRLQAGTESAYTHSHKLYSSLLRTMTAAAKDVNPRDSSVWEVIIAFRRFLQTAAHPELQSLAVNLYCALSSKNADAVWLALTATFSDEVPSMAFLREKSWDGWSNVCIILEQG